MIIFIGMTDFTRVREKQYHYIRGMQASMSKTETVSVQESIG